MDMIGVWSLDEIRMKVASAWPQARRWATKGGLAVLDQGLFSGANFLVNILLARWLAPEEYGAFAVAVRVLGHGDTERTITIKVRCV